MVRQKPDALTLYLEKHDITALFQSPKGNGPSKSHNTPYSPSASPLAASSPSASTSPSSISRRRLEKELKTAAEVGQALLQRHRSTLRDNRNLKAANDELKSHLIAQRNENHRVLEQYQDLLLSHGEVNSALKESNLRLSDANEQLISAKNCNSQMNQLRHENLRLVSQVEYLEHIQEQLVSELETTKESKRAAEFEWHKFERKFEQLQTQLFQLESQIAPESPIVMFKSRPTSKKFTTSIEDKGSRKHRRCVSTNSALTDLSAFEYHEDDDHDTDSTIPTSPDISFESAYSPAVTSSMHRTRLGHLRHRSCSSIDYFRPPVSFQPAESQLDKTMEVAITINGTPSYAASDDCQGQLAKTKSLLRAFI